MEPNHAVRRFWKSIVCGSHGGRPVQEPWCPSDRLLPQDKLREVSPASAVCQTALAYLGCSQFSLFQARNDVTHTESAREVVRTPECEGRCP